MENEKEMIGIFSGIALLGILMNPQQDEMSQGDVADAAIDQGEVMAKRLRERLKKDEAGS